jgi:vacuolar protein sorting-associated protein 3
LVLAGSRLYDPEIIRERIVEEKREKVLSLEIALLEGKVNSHLHFAIHKH